MLHVCEFVWNFSVLVKIDDNTKNKNSLAVARILSVLNNFPHKAVVLAPAIILLILMWM
jgi:hypothetical protein